MRRPGHYGDSGGNPYVASQIQHMSGQRIEHKSGHYQGRPEPLTSNKEHAYGASKTEGQWRWEADGSKLTDAMSPRMFSEGQGGDPSRSYFQGQKPDPKIALEKHDNNSRSQPHEENMDIGYEDGSLSQTFDGLEQKFIDDIMKLSKEQNDAEDAENARHRERIHAINIQYQEQLSALRARYASRRDEFLRKESLARKQQYQQAMMDHYNSGVGPTDPRGYDGVAAAAGEAHRVYNANHYDSYRERARFLGGTARDHGFDPRGPYPGSRVYDTGSRYY
ncbi:hypothetical protein NMG60_11015525 [Bertholletia excelsa]